MKYLVAELIAMILSGYVEARPPQAPKPAQAPAIPYTAPACVNGVCAAPTLIKDTFGGYTQSSGCANGSCGQSFSTGPALPQRNERWYPGKLLGRKR